MGCGCNDSNRVLQLVGCIRQRLVLKTALDLSPKHSIRLVKDIGAYRSAFGRESCLFWQQRLVVGLTSGFAVAEKWGAVFTVFPARGCAVIQKEGRFKRRRKGLEDEREIRAALNQYWAASASGD